MNITDVLDLDRIDYSIELASKKRVLERISELVAPALDDAVKTDIYECILARERLGSTGLGHGVAIPHGRLKNVAKTIGAFMVLSQGIDFDAADRAPVDLIFALVVPEDATEEHLQLLAKIAAMFNDNRLREALREAVSKEELLSLLNRWQDREAVTAASNL